MSEFSREHNRIVWTDVPVKDLTRAIDFYQTVLAIKVNKESYGDVEFAVLEHSEGNGGCLVVEPENVTDKGSLNYFNVHGRLEDAVANVSAKGGEVLLPPHAIGPYGQRAIVLDSEGNRIALHTETTENS